MNDENNVVEEAVDAPAVEAGDDSAEKQLVGLVEKAVTAAVSAELVNHKAAIEGQILRPATGGLSSKAKKAIKHMTPAWTEKYNDMNDMEKKEWEGTVVSFKFLQALKRRDFAVVKDLSEGTDSEGGFLVPSPLAARIFEIVTAQGHARREMTILPMTAETLDLSTLATKPTVAVIGEGAQITASDPVFGRKTLTATKVAGITAMSSELLEDANINLTPYLIQKFAEAFMDFEDEAFFNTNASANITGILEDAGTNNVVMGAGNTAFANLTLDNLIDAVYALDARQRVGAKWCMSSDIIAIIAKLNDSQNRPLWDLTREGQPQQLLGYPIVENDQMPVTADDAVSTSFIEFGNYKSYVVGDRKAMKATVLTEGTVGATNLAEKDSVAVRVVQRLSGIAPTPLSFSKITTAAV